LVILEGDRKDTFRFQHVPTDETFGSLGPEELFRIDTPDDPSSPIQHQGQVLIIW